MQGAGASDPCTLPEFFHAGDAVRAARCFPESESWGQLIQFGASPPSWSPEQHAFSLWTLLYVNGSTLDLAYVKRDDIEFRSGAGAALSCQEPEGTPTLDTGSLIELAIAQRSVSGPVVGASATYNGCGVDGFAPSMKIQVVLRTDTGESVTPMEYFIFDRKGGLVRTCGPCGTGYADCSECLSEEQGAG